MADNLVIVESPAKAKTIEKFLGKDFIVKSSFGHVRDLSKKNFGIDIKNNFTPNYEISPDKKKVVSELKKLAKNSDSIWLASDEDREGEAIAWHLSEVLKLDINKTKRIVFHEITKTAIQNAIKEPRAININLVNAQQARRILDRLVGFEMSPVLWKKVKPSLSAGRVQSVAVRLIVEREREIINFTPDTFYKTIAIFSTGNNNETFKAELNKNLSSKKEVFTFLNECKNSKFSIIDIQTKPGKKSPSAPFTTSTLQQEASRKLGFSVSQTMVVAQKLYEAGKITYMRTDSVNLSNLALQTAKNKIQEKFGDNYYQFRKYKTKSKSAQEAHEAIRPTFIDKETISGSAQEQKLYNLIWKRTVASQMQDAKFEKTTAKIDISGSDKLFIANGEVLKFDGFLKLYFESTDNGNGEKTSTRLPVLTKENILSAESISSTQRFSYQPPRYTEASLVRKLEELGIGRPSTYAPTISTIQNRGYVAKEDRPGTERTFNFVLLENNEIKEETKTEITGTEKSKLFPTDIGMVVNDFLIQNFKTILDFNFTANIEKQFDEIALGKTEWTKMLSKFYNPFHTQVIETLENTKRNSGERILGTDPGTGKEVSVKLGKYGPIAQLGKNDEEEKPRFAGLRKGQHLETITLDEALELFKLPRKVGLFEDAEMVVSIGRFGPYVRHDSKFYSLKKGVDDPYTIERNRAIEIIKEKREADKKKLIKEFAEDKDVRILNGRWGAYISYKKKNYKIPKKTKAEELSLEDCMNIISEQFANKSVKSGKKKSK
ncbi:MAG: type I DNA topoisomerase [Chlorobi bacterium]|nr:type I DNA topoisomerase [Chlorobiota bacterium]